MRQTRVVGIVAPSGGGSLRARGAALLRSSGLEGTVEMYPARTYADLQLRFAEMFLHDRAAYVLHSSLRTLAVPLLDVRDPSVDSWSAVDVVLNRGGVLLGLAFPPLDPEVRWEHLLRFTCHALKDLGTGTSFSVSRAFPHDLCSE